MAVKPWVVQSDYWAGGQPQGSEGALLIRKGTVVDIDPANNTLANFYGGWSNLAPLPPTQMGDDANHAALQD
jgi:hypothetical protein